jgi:DNA-binding HxlR family transcriptional regulator
MRHESSEDLVPSEAGSIDVFLATSPTRWVLDIIADKWTVLIIGALSNGTRGFQQLRRKVDGVTQTMLTQTRGGWNAMGW